MLSIGSRRECFFDEYLIDTGLTTAEFRLHEPVRRERVLVHDAPWEGDGCDFHNILKDDDLYRMYYLGWWMLDKGKGKDIYVCYAESKDGLNWIKPNLGLFEYEGSTDNNIILTKEFHGSHIDNFMVFKDTNPACPADALYKAVAFYKNPDTRHPELHSYISSDGIRFTKKGLVTDKGQFDTLNVAFWDECAGKYRCYFRSFHDVPENGDLNAGIRDIRYIESADFVNWTEPVILDFGDAEDIPLYTNVVQPYPRAPHMLVGFPSRYAEYPEWTENFDELAGREKRLERMKHHPRYGLTVTDCVFMCSRDGWHFKRYDEAFMTPGPEVPTNWVYGDCYPSYGLIETPSAIPGADKELSFFTFDNHWMGIPTDLYRYSMRMDGFVSLHAGAKEQTIVTKPFTFEGMELFANLATSARGYVIFILTDENGKKYESCRTFGNSTDKRIHFGENVLASLAGKEVTLTMRIKDADIYSIQFR